MTNPVNRPTTPSQSHFNFGNLLSSLQKKVNTCTSSVFRSLSELFSRNQQTTKPNYTPAPAGSTELSPAKPTSAKQIEFIKTFINTHKLRIPTDNLKKGSIKDFETKILKACIDQDKPDLIKQLVTNHGFDPIVQIKGPKQTISLLQYAVQSGHIAGIKALLNTGKFDDAVKGFEGAALLLAVAYRGAEAIKTLLDTGKFDPNATNRQGETILTWGFKNGESDSLIILLETGKFDPTIENAQGQSLGFLAKANERTHQDLIKAINTWKGSPP